MVQDQNCHQTIHQDYLFQENQFLLHHLPH
jgi:hypothetical protein